MRRALLFVWLALVPAVCMAQEPPPPEEDPCEISFGIDGFVGALLDTVIGGVFEAMRHWFCWLLDLSWSMCRPFFDLVANAIPTGLTDGINVFVPYLGFVNAWVPLDFMLGIIGAYFLFLLIFVVVKYILKLIPTIG